MRRPIALVVLTLCVVVVATGAPLAPSEPAAAQTDADWRGAGADADDELGLSADEGLSDAELEAVVERSMVRIESIRGVEFEERPSVTVVTREEFRSEYAGLGANPPEDRAAFENAKLRALFLVGGDENATAVQNENMDTAVAGFYSSETAEIVLVSNAEEPRVNELTLAHELVHAYQDQEWGLAGYDSRTQDGSSAELGLIEGDAVYLETLYEQRCGEEWECLIPADAEPGEGEQPDQPANLGLLLLDFYPYDSGPTFIESVHEAGGWAAVNDLYDEPPVTTEQVIDPAAYPADQPRDVAIEDTNSGDWERLEPDTGPDYDRLGMAAVTTMFINPLYDSGGQDWVIPADEWFTYEGSEPPAYGAFEYGHEYATGWDGDRLHVYENSEEIGYVWRLAWDSPDDADTFAAGFDDLLAYWGGERVEPDTYRIDDGGYEGAYHVTVDEETVTITHAPTVDALAAVSGDARPGTGGSPGETADEPTREDGDGDDAEDTGDALPGFGIPVALATLAIAAYLLVRRR
ncbi:Hvo_1808 family surface protein [Halalkalicoccus subterraneus]|uniref:Hvo_1808 family surface protein n=1 Tax=Halalkalicoccus subterraneus TaxID=2675002 RepID=UPI000EFAC95F|nr:Hvo_1808 family surface protein [Halalkalicoccus subterraneus]